MTFHDNEHRINNAGWIRNGDETEEWNEKQNHGGNADRFSIDIFSIRNEVCLEFALAKLRGLCKYLADAYNSNSHVCGLHCLTFVYENKAGKSTQWGESSFRKCIKKELSVISQNMEKSPCKLNLLHCRQKTTTSLWKRKEKGIGRTRKMRPQANSAQYNTQGWDVRGGGGWSEETVGGGGGAAPFVLTYKRAGWNGMTIHILFNSY